MIYSALRYLLACSFILLTWTSCKTATPATVLPSSNPPKSEWPLSEADKEFIREFSKKVNLPHLVFGCKITDINGTMIASFPGRLCWFEDNGHMLNIQSQLVIHLDPVQKVKWIKNKRFFHHSFKKSQFKDEFLTLNSEYLGTKEWRSVRFDELIVMGRDGRILKNFKFSEYDLKHPLPRPPQDDTWTVEKEFGTKEFTHGNSFSELWTRKNGKKNHTGYLYYGTTEEYIYLFDRTLKRVTAKLGVPGRRLHAVQQYNDRQLIAYGNISKSNGPGVIILVDIKTGAIEELYKFTDRRQGSAACSSVQFLPEDRLFLVHSKCDSDLLNNTFVEYVDLKSGKSAIQWIDLPYPEIGGYMANLNGFFENNYSH